jgi:hypothetical protein
MKKSVFTLAITMCIMALATISCKSNEEKEADAIENIQEANQDLNEVSQEEQLAANDEQWNIFKEETETKISANEAIISNLRLEMEKPGNKFDAVYKKNIEELERKNSNLRSRIDEYDKTRSDWEAFKREFNHDMEEIGKSLKDITVNNTK